MGFRGDSAVKNLPAMQELQELQVQFPSQEDPLEEGMTTPPVFLLGEFHGQGFSPRRSQKSWTQLSVHTHTHTVSYRM